jgi:hypothetical protein
MPQGDTIMSEETRTEPQAQITNPIAVIATEKVKTRENATDPDPACCTAPPDGDPGDTKG